MFFLILLIIIIMERKNILKWLKRFGLEVFIVEILLCVLKDSFDSDWEVISSLLKFKGRIRIGGFLFFYIWVVWVMYVFKLYFGLGFNR